MSPRVQMLGSVPNVEATFWMVSVTVETSYTVEDVRVRSMQKSAVRPPIG